VKLRKTKALNSQPCLARRKVPVAFGKLDPNRRAGRGTDSTPDPLRGPGYEPGTKAAFPHGGNSISTWQSWEFNQEGG
jgi:hypothetical protein